MPDSKPACVASRFPGILNEALIVGIDVCGDREIRHWIGNFVAQAVPSDVVTPMQVARNVSSAGRPLRVAAQACNAMTLSFDITSFKRLKATGNLPSPQGAALAIMRATQSEDVSLVEVARVVKGDPAFVGRLIRAANGLVGYRQRPIVAVQDALTVLGLPAVRHLALCFSLLSSYRAGTSKGFDYDRYWSSSLLTGVAMQALATPERRVPTEESYSVGLLSRIGELALATVFPERYDELRAQPSSSVAERLIELERRQFGTDHRELGAAMIHDWGFPEIFCEAVYVHEAVGEGGSTIEPRVKKIADMLALSRAMAHFCLATGNEQLALARGLVAAAWRLEIDKAALATIGDRISLDWSGWASLLKLQTRPLPPFAELIADHPGMTPVMPMVEAPVYEESPPRVPVRRNTGGARSRMRVLVAGQEAKARTQIRELLEAAGHEVQEANSALLAAELVLLVQPHMVIVDWALAGGPGLDLVERLRRIPSGRTLHLLVLTPSSDEQTVVDIFEAGADDYLAQPLSSRVLLARLKAAQRIVDLHHEIEQERNEIRLLSAELAASNRLRHDTVVAVEQGGTMMPKVFFERLRRECASSLAGATALACMAVGVDEIESLEQTYGADFASAAETHVSACLAKVLRSDDLICHSARGVFLVCCPKTAQVDAKHAAERARRAVESTTVSSNRLQVRLTVSIGLAGCGETTFSADMLIEAAQAALESAKAEGRNRVACTNPT